MNVTRDKNIIKICLIGILVLYYINYLSTWIVNRWAVLKEIKGYVKVLIDIDSYCYILWKLGAPILSVIVIWKVIMLLYHILENKKS